MKKWDAALTTLTSKLNQIQKWCILQLNAHPNYPCKKKHKTTSKHQRVCSSCYKLKNKIKSDSPKHSIIVTQSTFTWLLSLSQWPAVFSDCRTATWRNCREANDDRAQNYDFISHDQGLKDGLHALPHVSKGIVNRSQFRRVQPAQAVVKWLVKSRYFLLPAVSQTIDRTSQNHV